MSLTPREWSHGESLRIIKARLLAEIEEIDAQLTAFAAKADPAPPAKKPPAKAAAKS